MKGVASHLVKHVVIGLIIIVIMSRYPLVKSVNITGITPLGGGNMEVRGTVVLRRGSAMWTGPDNFYWFNLWWQSEEAAEKVFSESHGMIRLHSITWTLVEEKRNSDVLRFEAIITVDLTISPPWHGGWHGFW